MEVIRKFFGLLEKQGLLIARLRFQEWEYRYSRDVGYREIPPDPADRGTPGAETIAREEIPFVSEIAARKRLFRKYIWISVSLASLLALVVVAYTLWLDKGPAQDSMNKSDLEAVVGEKTSVGDNPLQPSADIEAEYNDTASESGRVAAGTDSASQPSEYPEIKTPPSAGDQAGTKKPASLEPAGTKGQKTGQVQPKTRTLLIHNLKLRQIKNYNQILQTVRVACDEELKISGYLTIKLDINSNGGLKVVGYNADGMTVHPRKKKGRAIQAILSHLAGLRLDPPHDNQAGPVRIKNWRLNFQTSFFRKRIILRKQ